MRVSELHIYPVKGAAGIPVPRVQLDAFGVAGDRRWMIVDEAGTFLSQRERPELGRLNVELVEDGLVLRSDRAGEARVTRPPADAARRRVRVWHDEVDAVDGGDAAAAILSAHLGSPARLVHMPDSTLRPVHPPFGRPGDRVNFADAFPLLLIGQASLDALNARLTEPVSMLRFRPNIVIEGTTPHAEDAWRRIRIGAVDCDVVKPCARCVVTTLDPATSRAGKEPLRTLATYRRWKGLVWFGQNAIHRVQGGVAVGDVVEVLIAGTPQPPLAPPRGQPAGTAGPRASRSSETSQRRP